MKGTLTIYIEQGDKTCAVELPREQAIEALEAKVRGQVSDLNFTEGEETYRIPIESIYFQQ